MNRLVIFGAGDMARIAAHYFETDSAYEIVAFVADAEYCNSDTYLNKPLLPFEELAEKYPPSAVKVFVAVSYSGMNRVREEKLAMVKASGYGIASYVSSRCHYLSQFEPGENAFVLEDNTIQPFVKIGSNVWLWSGNHVGHDSVIEDNVYISSHVVVSGFCRIGRNSFLGVNCTLRERLVIAPFTLIGAGVAMMKDSEEGQVWLSPRPFLYDKRSTDVPL